MKASAHGKPISEKRLKAMYLTGAVLPISQTVAYSPAWCIKDSGNVHSAGNSRPLPLLTLFARFQHLPGAHGTV
jgi:hypothetical protein